MRNIARCTPLMLSGLVAFQAFAHSSPLEAIARITAEIDKEGATVRRLVQRAVEYRTLREYPAAECDLNRALEIDPADFMALRELAQVGLSTGNFAASLTALDRALSKRETSIQRFGLFALRSEVHATAGRIDAALHDIALALEADRPEVDWYLQRSRLQWTAGHFEARVTDLRIAAQRNPSIVLQHELTDALIDAGHFEEGSSRVEDELEKCRDCASWRIRRARIRQAQGDEAGAASDLRFAIASLTNRLEDQKNSPLDVTTIVERAMAHALAGDTAKAKRGLSFAKAMEADEWLTAPLARILDSSIRAFQ